MGVEIQWGLLGNQPDIGGRFQQGFQIGQQQAIQNRTQNALAALTKNPDDQNALATAAIYNPQAAQSVLQMREYTKQQARRAALASAIDPATGMPDYAKAAKSIAATDPEGAMAFAQQQQQQQQAKLAYADKVNAYAIQNLLPTVKDEASWQAAKAQYTALYQRVGLEPPQLPDHYDKEMVDAIRERAMTPAEQLNYEQPDIQVLHPGDVMVDTSDPRKVIGASPVEKIIAGPTGIYAQPAYQLGSGTTTPPTSVQPGAPASQFPPERAAMLRAIWNQESSNGQHLVGQPTEYGTPLGIGQTLPATAQAMAQKLGLPWRPELLTQKTPDALQYQRALSAAYLDEAAKASGGYNEDAARYYYGGPNKSIWGSKTHAYSQAIMGRMATDPMYAAARPVTVTHNGKTYTKVDGKWFEQPQMAESSAAGSDGGEDE